ncbi:MAG: YraN family protein [Cyanobacteria bacterium RM1_2_2]|nr:YraN family protein [Cyanobacteria bacterium RM1_2_2]
MTCTAFGYSRGCCSLVSLVSSSQSDSAQPRRPKSAQAAEMGQLAENFVAQWLTEQGWQVIEQRWHCRWGELDLVMLSLASGLANSELAFVEVKARSKGNWDGDGLLAMTVTKREKLVRAAQAFLSAHPQWANLPCRFDVALVHARSCPPTVPVSLNLSLNLSSNLIQLGQPVAVGAYHLTLQHYIPGAFD